MQSMIIHDSPIDYHRFRLEIACNILFHKVSMFFHRLLMIKTEIITNNRVFFNYSMQFFLHGRILSPSNTVKNVLSNMFSNEMFFIQRMEERKMKKILSKDVLEMTLVTVTLSIAV